MNIFHIAIVGLVTLLTFFHVLPKAEVKHASTSVQKPVPTHSTSSGSLTPGVSEQADNTITPQVTSQVSPTQASQTGFLQSFFYPDSTVSQQSNTSLSLSSTDNPDNITSWYTQVFKNLGFKSTAIAKTSTNGQVVNKLSGANASLHADISITKNNNENVTSISVTLQNGENTGTNIQIHQTTY